jgi:hypothetical protein
LKAKTILILALLWLVIVWASFLLYQNQSLLKENHAGDYLASGVKVAIVLLAATGFGLRLRAVSQPALGDVLVACALGLAALGIVVLALASGGLLRSYAAWMVIAVMAGISYRQVARMLSRLRAITDLASPHTVSAVFGCLMVFAAGVCLINCLAPLTANDALVYHLTIPKIYVSQTTLVHLPHNVYANMPHYGELLYTLFYSVSGETGAKIFYLFLLLAAGGAIYALARRFVGRVPAVIGVSCFLVQPLVIDHRIICNVDVLLAYFYVSSIILALDLCERKQSLRNFVGLGLLAGFMLGSKYTALLPCLTLLPVLRFASSRMPRLRHAIAGILMALVVFAPWLMKNQAYTGNPFYPVFESAFDGENWDEVQSRQLITWQRSMGMGRSAKAYLLLPFNVSLRGKPGLNYSRFDGTICPVLLCLLPFALFRRKRPTTVLIIMAVAGFAFLAVTSQQLRFLIPTLALASALAAIGVANLSKWIRGKAIWGVFSVIVLIEISGLILPDQYGRPFLLNSVGDRLAAATGTETRQSHLERNIQSFSMFTHVNQTLPSGEPVFLIWENRGYYLDRPYFSDSFFEASTVMRLVAASHDSAVLKNRIHQMGFRYVVVNEFLGDFFSRGYDPQDVTILKDFIAHHLKPLHSSNRLTLYEIVGP